MGLLQRMFPKPKQWGLRDNEGEFPAQLRPDSAGIVAGLHGAVELTPAQIASHGRPGMVVKVTGTVQFGAQGSVDAPLSGMTCAWYRSWVTTQRHSLPVVGGPGLQPVPDIVPSDVSSMRHGGASLRRALRNGAEISTVPFRVGDGDGFIELDPRTVDVDTDVLAANRVERPTRLDESLLVEWVLPHAQRVTVLGTLGPDLALLPGPDHALLVSTKDEQRILARHRAAEHRLFGRKGGHGDFEGLHKVDRSVSRFTIALTVVGVLVIVVLLLSVAF